VATKRQALGVFGEERVTKDCSCPKCKRPRTLVRLPSNFRCADIICDFCGYLAQVKAATVTSVEKIPRYILGAAWQPQFERMQAGIYFPLFLVLTTSEKAHYAIYYLSADLQNPAIFKPRSPLSATARRAGWTGFVYDLETVRSAVVRLR
jgi:type II restriction enzyme